MHMTFVSPSILVFAVKEGDPMNIVNIDIL